MLLLFLHFTGFQSFIYLASKAVVRPNGSIIMIIITVIHKMSYFMSKAAEEST